MTYEEQAALFDRAIGDLRAAKSDFECGEFEPTFVEAAIRTCRRILDEVDVAD
jgi:HEPN domain-containing protein